MKGDSMVRVVALFLLLVVAIPQPAPVGGAPARLGVVSARLEPGPTLTVAAPITLTVQFDQTVLLASWQWVGANGQPVPWGNTTVGARDLRPASNLWVGRGGAPPQ